MQSFLLIISLFYVIGCSPKEVNSANIQTASPSITESIAVQGPDITIAKAKQMMETSKDESILNKIKNVNDFFNQITYMSDSIHWKKQDYWATPFEFMGTGGGDCEDYAIAKYFTLLELGVKKESLYLAVVNVKASAGTHMVLLYVENKNSSPLVLDNLSFRVLPFSKRDDLTPVVAFNELNAYEFTKDKFTQLVTIDWQNNNKWDRVLNRVYKLNE